MHWANAQIIAWLGDQSGDTAGVIGHLSHILRAERIWLDRAHRRSPTERNTFVPYFQNQLHVLNDANRDDWLVQIRSGLDRRLEYRMFDGSPAASTVQDMILHVVTHGFHHRGQIASQIAALRLAQPPTAYITFTRSR